MVQQCQDVILNFSEEDQDHTFQKVMECASLPYLVTLLFGFLKQ